MKQDPHFATATIRRRAPRASTFPAAPQTTGRIVVAAALLVLSAACQPTDPTSDAAPLPTDLPPVQTVEWADLPGHVVTDHPLMLLPSRAWKKGQDDTWVLPQSASLLVKILDPPEVPLDVALTLPADGDEIPCLQARWNGEELPTAPSWDDRTWRLNVAPQMMTAGTHALSLRRCGEDSDAASDLPVVFETIDYGLADQRQPLFAFAVLRYQYLADLLTYGVTSAGGNEKLDGMVMIGPRRVSLGLPSAGGGSFSATLHNASRQDKRLFVRIGEATQSFAVPSLGRSRVHLAVPGGTERIELISHGGEAIDFFQIAAPHFVPAMDSTRDAAAEEGRAMPPIIVVTLDTTRRDALGVYGGVTGITPHLDGLASRATVFDNARSTAPWTLPSHASMFTGLYPTQHGAGVSSDHLESEITTLAERLRDHGYLTAGFAGGPLTGYLFGLAQGFSFYRNPQGDEIPADQMTDLVEGFLADYVEPVHAQFGRTPPVFLFINYFDPHFPYRAPQPHRQRADFDAALDAVDEPWRDLLDGSGHGLMDAVEGRLPFTDASRQALLAAYRAEMSFMDQELGRLLVALRQHHLLDEALILVTADHGELLGEGGYFTHNGRLDAELLEIPMIVKAPGQQRKERVDSLVSLVDVFPTVLEQAGLQAVEQDGISLLEAGRDALVERPWALSEEHDTVFHRLPSNMRLADHVHGLEGANFRRLTWNDTDHCFTGEPGTWRLQSPCAELDPAALTLQQRVAAEARESSAERVGLSAEEQEQLRALGYIQ